MIDEMTMRRFARNPTPALAPQASAASASSSTTPQTEPADPISFAPVDPRTHPPVKQIVERFSFLETEMYKARMDMRSYHAQMMEHNQRMYEYTIYQDILYRMQLTQLGADMNAAPPASTWMPPYPPLIPVPQNTTQGDDDEDDADEDVNMDEEQSVEGVLLFSFLLFFLFLVFILYEQLTVVPNSIDDNVNSKCGGG